MHDPFQRGDYLTAARSLSPESWQHWASMALLGRADIAARQLVRFDDPDARFYVAVAHWIAGDDEQALAMLDRLSSEHARRLAALIRRRPITVLAQLPWNRGGPWDLLSALRDPTFNLLNISFHRHDIQNRPYADVRTLVPGGVTPDFYVAAMLEWHLLPPNVRELGCPVLGTSSDFDLHIQAVAPWLDLFDEIVVLDDEEWRQMRGLVSVPVSVFPKVFGVPAAVPVMFETPRPIDVFVSGTVLHPYHGDKDAVILELLRLPDARLRLVNGFEPKARYFRSLAAAKMCCTHVRHPGAMPTRGIEALAMGCVVAVQEDSALRLFIGDEEGTVAYGPSSGALSARIAHVLHNWDDYARRAQRGAVAIREEFALPRVASEYLRLLTVLAARPRAVRATTDPALLVQKRTIVQKGWLPSYRFGGELLTQWATESVKRLDRQLADGESPQRLNDRARELLLAHYHDSALPDPAWLPEVVVPLERAIELFPDALVPRLNLIRVRLHFGGPETAARGLAQLEDALGHPPGFWHVSPLDDVLPWDFCASYFDYRRYFDAVTAVHGGDAGRHPELPLTTVAALHHYRALYAEGQTTAGRIGHAARAVHLAPYFPEYGLLYCRLLLERGLAADRVNAAAILRNIVGRSARLTEAVDLARALPPELRAGWADDAADLADRFWHATTMRAHLPEPPLRSVRGPAADVRVAADSAVY